jgi:putative hydrolase of the HAD superfamily
MPDNLLIDADDTLWENNIYFEQAIDAFIAFLNHAHLSHAEVRAMLDEVEHAMGYGTDNFHKSLLETHRRLAATTVEDADVRQIRQFADAIHAQTMELLPTVLETLAYLAPRHDLVLLTKGDPAEQQRKVDRSGLAAFFAHVRIVPEKDVTTYRALVTEWRLDPDHTWMVGNSPRSDINPALAAGLNAVFIPHPQTWRLEHEEVRHVEGRQLLILTTFAELRDHF